MTINKLLVTGAGGFWGRHFCKYIGSLDASIEIVGADISENRVENCSGFYNIDLTDNDEVRELIRRTKADCIVNLAGLFSADNNFQIFKCNVLPVINMLEAAREYSPNAIVITTGSAAEYGLINPGQLPVIENTVSKPLTAYGLSKLLASETAVYYHRVHGLCTMVVRPFQLIGRGVTARLAPGAFMEQINKCIVEGLKVIKVGNLESSRDFLDVTDAASALWKLIQNPAPGQIFNICSGRKTKLKDLLDLMIKISGACVEVELDKTLLRGRFDVPDIYGSNQKISQHCNWKPIVTLEQSVKSMLG